jgi:hypothetical protein
MIDKMFAFALASIGLMALVFTIGFIKEFWL